MVDDKKKNPSEEKRASPRVDFFSRVHVIPEDGSPIDVFSSNVSCGGIFLRSNRPLPTGKKVKLEFETNNGMVQVDVGEIVWTKPFDPVKAGEQTSGMGIKFKSMSEQSRIKIETFIDEILDTSQPTVISQYKPSAVIPRAPVKSAQSASAPVQSVATKKEPRSPARPPPLPRVSVVLEPPENSSPPELSTTSNPALRPSTIIPTSLIEPSPVENIQPIIITDSSEATKIVDSSISAVSTPDELPIADSTEATKVVDSSISAVSTPDELPQRADTNKTALPPDEALEREEFMASISPKPHKRVFLFGGFVLLVALVTFFTMFLLRSAGDEPSSSDVKETKPPAKSNIQPTNVTSSATKKNEPPESGATTSNAQPVVSTVQTSSKTDAGAKTTTSSVKDSAIAAKPAKADSHHQPAPTNIKEVSNDQLEVGRPVFEQGSHGWQLIIKANRACEIKHFKLDSPPRLAIDFPKAFYSGKLALDAPAPFVSKLRVGKQEWGVRFVIDFKGSEAPAYKLKVDQTSITVNFNPK